MEYVEHVAAVGREAGAMEAALRAGPVTDQVPTCPEWSVADLASHLVYFCGLWAHVLCEGNGRPKSPFTEPVPGESDGDKWAGWFAEQAGYLSEELAATGPTTPAWTWDKDNQTAAFVARRAAHELAVHRFDAQSARSAGDPIDGALAVDGIEEIFTMIEVWKHNPEGVSATGRRVGKGAGETLHLHAAEPEAEWTLTLAPDGLVVDRQHRKADLALRGTASDLELVLYDRPPLGPVDHLGDDTALAAWRRAFAFE